MKTFKEFRGESPITQIDEQVYFKIRIPDMSTMFMKATSESAVKLDMRKKLKPDVVKEVSIERVTKAEMRKIYRAMGQGKEDEKEPTEETQIHHGISTQQVQRKAADTTYHGPSDSAEIADKRRTLARMEKEYRDPSTPPSKKEQIGRTIERIKDRIKAMQSGK